MQIRETEYVITGTCHNEKFTILFNGDYFSAWIFILDELKCVFREDLDDYSFKLTSRVKPAMVMQKDLNPLERADLYRLAVMSRYINSSLKKKG